MSNMRFIRRQFFFLWVVFACLFSLHDCELAVADNQTAKELCDILYSGRLAQGETELVAKLAKNDEDAATRASLGIVQFIKAVEELSQDYYRFGVEPQRGIAVGNMLVPRTANPIPKPISYSDARGIFERVGVARALDRRSTPAAFLRWPRESSRRSQVHAQPGVRAAPGTGACPQAN